MHGAIYAEAPAGAVAFNHTLTVWNLATGRLLHVLEGHTALIRHTMIDAGGRRALSTSDDATLKVWDLVSGRLVHTLAGHTDSVSHAVIYDEDRRAISASFDGTLKIWDLAALEN